jgi:thiamine-monophosphate kinase
VTEFELIARILPSLPTNESVVVGAGDDCAVLNLGLPGRHLLFKTDAVVEGVHFLPDALAERVGHKALARCLSDIAAMGGTAGSAVVSLGLPADRDPAWAEGVYQGLRRLALKYQVAIVGGETTACPHNAFLSVAVLGQVEAGKAVLRSGAKVGDAIFVTGELGGSRAGRHLTFEPRLEEARWLCRRFDVHAMIDLSDGLAGDLRHLLQASHVGAELLTEAIPVSPAAKSAARRAHGATAALTAALTDGEDFELLFTVAPADAVPLLDQWKTAFPELRLGCVGKITSEPGVRLRDRKGARPLTAHGYVHFQ